MKIQCDMCKGTGAYHIKLHDLGGRIPDSEHLVNCDQLGCENGIVDTEVYYASIMQWGIRQDCHVDK